MKMLIAGKWVDRKDKLKVLDPYDGSLVDTVPAASDQDVEAALAGAVEGARIARNMPTHERRAVLIKAAALMEKRSGDLAATIAREGSKTIVEARKEVSRAINTMTYSGEEAVRICGETLNFDSFPGSENRTGYYYRFPIGVILAITPFNDPLNLVAHKVGPALAGGNAMIIKPATVTPLSAIKLVKCLVDAGLDPRVVSVITGQGSVIGDRLVEDDRVRMVSFTGGVEAGRQVASKAGIKKIGMELGSNCPTLVFDDCDFNLAVESCVSGAFWACGQNCIGVQRVYVQQGIYEKFKKKFVQLSRKYRKVGPKLDEDCSMGPLISEPDAIRVKKWIDEAVASGAKLLCGGKRTGSVVTPAVLEGIKPKCRLAWDEVFGPAVGLYPFRTADEAIKKANNVNYGLLAGVFTSNVETALKVSQELDCGGVMVNESSDYRLDAMPFGGVKLSGLGREGIRFVLQEMTEPKVVCFNQKGRYAVP